MKPISRTTRATSLAPAIRVMLVDDDRAQLETSAALLDEEFEVRIAHDGLEALELLKRESVQVVVTDYNMAKLDGVELLQRVRILYPSTSGILVTGIREQLKRRLTADEAIFAVLYKPYDPEGLLRTIREAAKMGALTAQMERLRDATSRLRDNGGKG